MSLELYGMTCGWLAMPLPMMLEGETGVIKVPLPSYLIKHPKGLVVFDTGLSMGMQGDKEAQHAEIGDAAYGIEPYFSAGEEIGARLSDAGIDPGSIDIIVNSHLHPDHAGGNAQIPNARVIVQRNEWECGCSENCAEHLMNPAHYRLGQDMQLIDGEHDVFGDGTVVCIPTYGHTVGHQSLKLKMGAQEIILTADACYFRKTLDDMHLPGLVNDRDQMLESLNRLRAAQRSGAQLIFGHDPVLWPKLSDGPLRQIAFADVELALVT